MRNRRKFRNRKSFGYFACYDILSTAGFEPGIMHVVFSNIIEHPETKEVDQC